MRFGVHGSIAPRLTSAPKHAAEIGCESFQIFPGNPRGWKKAPLDPDEVAGFRLLVDELGLGPVVVHATYLLNLASPDDELCARSTASLLDELSRAEALGAGLYVLHPGNHVGSGEEQGLRRLAGAIDEVGPGEECSPLICLENTAGGGTSLGGDIERLSAVLDMTRHPERVALAFDTAHGFAAGYAIHTPRGLRETMKVIDSSFGMHRLQVIHCNDSKVEAGSRRDRHEHIGKGILGRKGLRNFLSAPELAGLPVILETPVDEDGDDKKNLRAARRLAPK